MCDYPTWFRDIWTYVIVQLVLNHKKLDLYVHKIEDGCVVILKALGLHGPML